LTGKILRWGIDWAIFLIKKHKQLISNAFLIKNGGEGGIRTHGTPKRTTDFESAPFGLSGTSPSGAHHNIFFWEIGVSFTLRGRIFRV
jgi:hypothetical protein